MLDVANRLRPFFSARPGTPWVVPGALWVLLLTSAFVVWVTVVFPWIGFHELSQDEGYNMAKAALVHAGFGLYRDIWSDQPPVLTFVLSSLQWVFPWSVLAGRLVVLGSAALLLGSLFVLIARLHDRRTALCAVVLLGTAPMFIRLSVSIMIGLPSVALAVAAMAVATAARPALTARMALAGLLFALSLQTKLFTFLLAPALVAAILFTTADAVRGERKRALGVFFVACALGLSLVTLLAGDAFMAQLIRPHVSGQLRNQYSLADSAGRIGIELGHHAVLVGAGMVGLVLTVARWRFHPPEVMAVLWLFVPGIALLLHTPVWGHQVLLLLVPLAWFGGMAVVAVAGGLWARGGRAGRGVAVVGVLGLLLLGVTEALNSRGSESQGSAKRALAELVQGSAERGRWMVTDSPLDAFRARLLVPPELAVYSMKRVMAGELDPSHVIKAIERWHPHQLSFRRVFPKPELQAYLDRHFVRTFQLKQFSHHLPAPQAFEGDAAVQVGQQLDRLLDGFAATAVEGGFAGGVAAEGGARFGEKPAQPIGPTSVYMRPPGSTPRVGACFLQAHALTGRQRHLETAIRAAEAMVRTQSCSGGWLPAAHASPACVPGRALPEKGMTLDEGMVAEAIGFLLDLHSRELPLGLRADLRRAIVRSLDFLVATQNAHGAWRYDFSQSAYAAHSTLNDDLTTSHIRILLRAHRVFGEPRFRRAAIRGIDFLLRTQSPNGGWAQQYDDALRPAPARTFEPAALATIETAQVVRTLLDASADVDDARIPAAVVRAGKWLEASAVGVNRWARFHDLRSNRPVFQDRQGRRYNSAKELPTERQNGYRWEGPFPEVADAIARARAVADGDRKRMEATLQYQSLMTRAIAQGRARAWWSSQGGASPASLTDADGHIWSKDFIDRCGLLQSLLR